ncbi:MAG: DUF5596 domain-containing protein [Clostridia bacterium]|nr:DUF5596 domain-containing protein [Clostridia bacterium]
MKKFLEKFDIGSECDNFAKYFELAKHDFEEKKNEIFDFEKYGVFTYMKGDISAIRDSLADDSDNAIYCYFLYRAIEADDMAAIKSLAKPKAALLDEKYDTLPLFALLYCVPKMIETHKNMGIDADITEATCNMFENQVQDFVDLNHRYGISHYVTWMLHFLKCEILRIGRFNFEKCIYRSPFDIFENNGVLKAMPKGVTFHKSGQVLGSIGCEDSDGSFVADIEENDECYIGYNIENGVCENRKITLRKDEWKKVLTQGDTVVSVHIPSGGKMTDEVCERDIARCRKVFDASMGGYKAFYCHSWLLDPQIKTLMGKETNLTKFADRFEKFPTKSNGGDVFEYVYLLPSTTLPEKLPENTSFGIAVKKHLVSGGHVYGSKGVFL